MKITRMSDDISLLIHYNNNVAFIYIFIDVGLIDSTLGCPQSKNCITSSHKGILLFCYLFSFYSFNFCC